MMKIKKFLTLGVTTLAFVLPTLSHANNDNLSNINLTQTKLNQMFSVQDTIHLIGDSNFSNQEKDLEKNAQITLMKTFQAGLVQYSELPTSVKLSFIKRFANTEESSHYKEEGNEIKLSYKNDIKDNQSFIAVNEIEAAIKKNPNLQTIKYNKNLLNQFVFLHELSHSINHHQENKSFVFNDPNSILSQVENNIFEKETKVTFDENFADTYAAMILLKLNNFSNEAIQMIEIVAKQRDFESKKIDLDLSNKPDAIDCHSSFYSLNNVLNNIDAIKSAKNTSELRQLAQQYASNGTSLAYQKYTTYHTSSFEASKLSQLNEYFLQTVYNKINEGKPNFTQIKKESFALSKTDEINLDNYLNKLIHDKNNPLMLYFDIKNTESEDAKEVMQAAQQSQQIESNIIQYGYVRFMFNNYLKNNPNYSLNIAKKVLINNINNDTNDSIAQQLLISKNIDAKFKVANEASISPEMSQNILAQSNLSNTIENNNSKINSAMANVFNDNTQKNYTIPNIKAKREIAQINPVSDHFINTTIKLKQ